MCWKNEVLFLIMWSLCVPIEMEILEIVFKELSWKTTLSKWSCFEMKLSDHTIFFQSRIKMHLETQNKTPLATLIVLQMGPTI
jgi:hypothetical protein